MLPISQSERNQLSQILGVYLHFQLHLTCTKVSERTWEVMQIWALQHPEILQKIIPAEVRMLKPDSPTNEMLETLKRRTSAQLTQMAGMQAILEEYTLWMYRDIKKTNNLAEHEIFELAGLETSPIEMLGWWGQDEKHPILPEAMKWWQMEVLNRQILKKQELEEEIQEMMEWRRLRQQKTSIQ